MLGSQMSPDVDCLPKYDRFVFRAKHKKELTR